MSCIAKESLALIFLEIGHLLGLDHSNVAGSVMFPSYGGQRRALTPDDLAGIQSLYGKRGPALRVLVHLQNIGDRAHRDNEFAGTRGQSRRLEGFQIDFNPAVSGLGIRYMAHLQGVGDVPFVNAGQFIGTRGPVSTAGRIRDRNNRATS
jgi:hypothetical protein